MNANGKNTPRGGSNASGPLLTSSPLDSGAKRHASPLAFDTSHCKECGNEMTPGSNPHSCSCCHGSTLLQHVEILLGSISITRKDIENIIMHAHWHGMKQGRDAALEIASGLLMFDISKEEDE